MSNQYTGPLTDSCSTYFYNSSYVCAVRGNRLSREGNRKCFDVEARPGSWRAE